MRTELRARNRPRRTRSPGDRLRLLPVLCVLLVLSVPSASVSPAANEPPPDPAATPTPIPEEEFQQKLSRWSYISFARIGPILEATLHDRETNELRRVEEGDTIEGLTILTVDGSEITVSIGGREGKLDLVSDSSVLTIIDDDLGPYSWNRQDGQPVIVTDLAFRGEACLRSTGDNRLVFLKGSEPRAGTGPGMYSRLNLALYLVQPNSDLIVQVRGAQSGWKRWGFDADKTYRVGYRWRAVGTTTGIPSGRWRYYSIDLVRDLGLPEGDTILELGFAAHGKRTLIDAVSLSRTVPAGAKAVRGTDAVESGK